MAQETFFWAVRYGMYTEDGIVWAWQTRDGAPLLYATEAAAREAAEQVDHHLRAEVIPIYVPPLPQWE